MKLDKALKEASAEVSGSGPQERIKLYINKKELDSSEARTKMPNAHKALMKAINKAKSEGFDFSPKKAPADVTIKGNGDVVAISDTNNKTKRYSLEELGFDKSVINKIKQEIS